MISPRASLHGLTGEDLYGTSCSGVNLIVHHVLEALVISRPKEHLSSRYMYRVCKGEVVSLVT